ncbi:MAG: aldehyde dehydrogenase family protein, partial [Acidobacteria bacterium]
MQTETKPPLKVTYATMTADQMEELHREFDAALERVESALGQTHPMYIAGQAVKGPAEFEDRSPIDTRILLGRFQKGTREQVRHAIAAARDAYGMWSQVPWEERVDVMRKATRELRRIQWDIAAVIGYEVGKNRLEAVGEVEEVADFFDYYCNQMEANEGYTRPMGEPGGAEQSVSVLRPLGVWAVIAPFNFPVALAAGPACAAILAGNTVVSKPASDTPWSGLKLHDVLSKALPPGVFNVVTGGGGSVGQELLDNEGIDGIVFTGSMEVGMKLIRENAVRRIPRPVVIEMGGKNPTLVMPSADIDRATDGVMRSAFGAQGQKCSACSRVYVEKTVRDRFVEMLVEKTRKIKIGNPLHRDVWMGPVINEAAVKTYEEAVALAKRDGGRILVGGQRMTGEPFGHGYYVEPTLIDGLPKDHRLFQEELFVPITVLADVITLDEAIDLANRTEYGLTAGIFTEDEREIAQFFDRV